MSRIAVSAMRLFFLGMLLSTLPGVVPPFFGSLHFVVSIASWLSNVAAVVCFFFAFRKASTSP
jgi:hypothetical protein